jgi:putative membrane protein
VKLLARWTVIAIAVATAAWLVPGIRIEGGVAAYLLIAAVFGLVNALVRPIVRRLACGLIVLTLGLFHVVINALMLLLATALAQRIGVGVSIESFFDAILGVILIGVVSFLLSVFLPEQPRRRRR